VNPQIRQISSLMLGVSSGMNLAFFLRDHNIFNVIAGGLLLTSGLLSVVIDYKLKPQPTEIGLGPMIHMMDQVAMTYNEDGIWQPLGVPKKEYVADFSEQLRSLERKMFMKQGQLRNVWWHCYGGITNEQCDWGEGHYCMVILGESQVPPDDVMDNIAPAGSWTTPLTYLKSFDHDPTDDEKKKITPPDYRTKSLHTEKVRRP
jgi:hypothetical protein